MHTMRTMVNKILLKFGIFMKENIKVLIRTNMNLYGNRQYRQCYDHFTMYTNKSLW